ncbi:MAG: hypothetical protein WCK65_10000 [Rhodospirillaceae bacterium]
MAGTISASTVIPGVGHNNPPGKGKAMYAIAFDLETSILEEQYHNDSWKNAYADIRNALKPYGFTGQQGSVYFGDETVDAVQCVLAVMTVSQRFAWFEPAVKDIRMLRIEDNNDLMPAVRQAVAKKRSILRYARGK